MGYFEEAISQLDRWVSAHPTAERLPFALNERCWDRALLGKGLDLALADCNAALKRGLRVSDVLDSRALVWLRIGDFDNAIADYKAALNLQPKSAWSRYGLGVAELRKGMTAEGERDIQAAIEIAPAIGKEFDRIGIAP